ncbi:MAG: hypothetical protein NTW73_00725 [Candidatus Parcubacteria bacterium]|nr:hypothetical protein [Candidatus Parcubacteria bacterium]
MKYIDFLKKISISLKEKLGYLFSHAIFASLFFLILILGVFGHYQSGYIILAFLILLSWKFFKGLAWHNLFYLTIIFLISFFFSWWTQPFFNILFIIVISLLFWSQLAKAKEASPRQKFLSDLFFYVLFFYVVFSLIAAFFVFHWSLWLILIFDLCLTVLFTYFRLNQKKINFDSWPRFIAYFLINLEIFYLVCLMPLNYLGQALIILFWYYFVTELFKDQKRDRLWAIKILIQFAILLGINALLLI